MAQLVVGDERSRSLSSPYGFTVSRTERCSCMCAVNGYSRGAWGVVQNYCMPVESSCLSPHAANRYATARNVHSNSCIHTHRRTSGPNDRWRHIGENGVLVQAIIATQAYGSRPHITIRILDAQ